MDHFEEIKKILAESEQDRKKVFEKGNASAGIRLRKNLQKIKNICQDLRKLTFEQ